MYSLQLTAYSFLLFTACSLSAYQYQYQAPPPMRDGTTEKEGDDIAMHIHMLGRLSTGTQTALHSIEGQGVRRMLPICKTPVQ